MKVSSFGYEMLGIVRYSPLDQSADANKRENNFQIKESRPAVESTFKGVAAQKQNKGSSELSKTVIQDRNITP